MISSQYRTSHIKWIISYVMMYFKVFRMKYNVATTGNVMVCNMYMQTCRQKYCDNISLFWTFEILYKGFVWQTDKARQGLPTHYTKLFLTSINTYVQYRQKVWTHQVAAKPRFSRLPRTRFGRKITARFSGNAAVGRGRLVRRQNYLMTAAKTRKMGPYFLAALYMLNKLM